MNSKKQFTIPVINLASSVFNGSTFKCSKAFTHMHSKRIFAVLSFEYVRLIVVFRVFYIFHSIIHTYSSTNLQKTSIETVIFAST